MRPDVKIDLQHKVKVNMKKEQGYIFWPSPPPGGGKNFCPNWKTGKNLKEDLKKGKEKGEKKKKKKKRVIKHMLKYIYEA